MHARVVHCPGATLTPVATSWSELLYTSHEPPRCTRTLMLPGRFGGRVDLAVAAYNAGEGAVSSFMTGTAVVLRDGRIVNARGVVTGGIPPYAETQRYVRSVLALVNNSLIGSVNGPPLGLRKETRREFTLDAFDLPERAQTFYHLRASSFIEIQ